MYGFNGGWAEIRFGDMPAFIPKKLIEKATPVVPQPPKNPTSNALTQKQQQKDEPKTNTPEKLILKRKKEHFDDGYRWYEYVYNNKGGGNPKTLRAAFDENERQITPILESDNLSYTNGFFEVDTDEGHALYDKQGKCVIPSSLGFNIIWIHPDEGKVVAYNSNRAEETKRTFSFDGKPCADLASKTNNQQTTSNEDEDFEDYYEHVREGNEHLADCDYKAAARSYKKALKYQKDANVLFNLGVAQYNDGKYQRASKSFDEAYTMLRSQKGNSDLAERALQMKRLSANAASEKSQRVWGTVALVSSTVLAATAVAVAETELQKLEMERQRQQRTTHSNNNTISSSDDDDDDNYYEYETPKPKEQKKCRFCNGRGWNVESVASFGLAEKEYCSQCGKTMMSNHYHKTCIHCDGNGYE